jgi:GR25 family glycosyltransferase involved in LPS biosynthesis
MQPKTFCIALKNNDISIRLLNDCLDSANQFGWNIEIFNAVDGNSIDSNTWDNLGILPSADTKFQTRKGAQGCSLSHYLLWQKCISFNTPIVVLEHDALILSPWVDINTNFDVTKLYTPITKMKSDQYTGNWSLSTYAYYITPVGAEKLINWVKNNFLYHADTMLGTNVINFSHVDNTIVGLNPNNISTLHYKKNNLRI